jgi:hypothetical protein
MTKIKALNIGEISLAEALKGWVMVLLTLAFVLLYALALLGKLKPLADVTMVSRLEPIIFIIIGYYFGRLPGQQNEQTLKEEIGRQTQKAEAAEHAKITALQTRESLDEKVKNARAALLDGDGNGTVEQFKNGETHSRASVATAVKILSS